MRLDVIYLLGSLWGGLPGPEVCSSSPAAASGSVHETARATAGVTAFVNVNVVPMDSERGLTDQTVVVEGGLITALGPSAKVQVPAGAVRIDGRGKYLIPGLADMHLHTRGMLGFATDTSIQNVLFRYLARGVTTIRHLNYADIDQQQVAWTHLRTAKLPIPRLYLAPKYSASMRPDSVATFVAAAKAAGFRHLGTPFTMRARDPEERARFDSLVAAARRVGLPISSHSHRLPFEGALALGVTGGSVEHPSSVFWDTLGLWTTYTYPEQNRQPVEVPLAKLPPLVAAVKRAGLWITPTLVCMEEAHPHIKGIPQLVKALQDAGVGLLLGTDDHDVHNELAVLVRAGLTPYQALVTGTRNVAQYFGELDSSGTVAVGKRADLVLLAGNPLDDIQHTREPAGVMIGGRWLPRVELDRRRAETQASAEAAP